MANPVTTKFQGWNITMTPDAEGKWSWRAKRKGDLAAQNPGTPSFDTKYQALEDAKAQLGKGKT